MEKESSNFSVIDDNPVVYSIRRGLILSIPLLIVGSFSLIFIHLPIGIYQDFIAGFAGGFLVEALTFINQVTFGVLSLCITITVSISYASLKSSNMGIILGAVFSSLSAYMIFIGLFTDSFNVVSFGASGMFTALFSAIVFSYLFMKFNKNERFAVRVYTIGADTDFNTVMGICIPVGLAIAMAFLLNLLINTVFDVIGLEALFHKMVASIFSVVESESQKIILYVVLSNFFWFFGVHGTNALFVVEDLVFADPSGVITKPFIDVFVLMGGSGTTISLLVAILLFSRLKNSKSLGKFALFPMIFNINEMMVFGLPIVFNRYFFIPFIVTPMACIAIAYVAISAGIVPPPDYGVSWVAPVIINGYQSTGSVMGSLLQIINIAAGTFIYRFFLVRYEKNAEDRLMRNLDRLVRLLKEAEGNGEILALLELRGEIGGIAKMLAEDLTHVIKIPGSLQLFYQPQYDRRNKCIGMEALLRWNHSRCGMIYPPLLIGIAKETGLLVQLERQIIQMACQDIAALDKMGLAVDKVSVNATAATLQDASFVEYIENQLEQHPSAKGTLCIELTEQMSFMLSGSVEGRLNKIKQLGVSFAVDDFSMGHTSVKYLQSNLFDIVKIDGSLIKDMMTNPRCEEIIASIVRMSEAMGFDVIAEYVETKAQRDKLEAFGCYYYQGFYFSPAIALDELAALLRRDFAGIPPNRRR